MVYLGPTWLSIPRCDRRLHSFHPDLCDKNHSIEGVRPEGASKLKVRGKSRGGLIRTGDLMVFPDLEKAKLTCYMVTGFSWRNSGPDDFIADMQHFSHWLKVEKVPDSESLWWRSTLKNLTGRLHDFGRIDFQEIQGYCRVWFRSRRGVQVGAWWSKDLSVYFGGLLAPEGRPQGKVTNWDLFRSFEDAWKEVLELTADEQAKDTAEGVMQYEY